MSRSGSTTYDRPGVPAIQNADGIPIGCVVFVLASGLFEWTNGVKVCEIMILDPITSSIAWAKAYDFIPLP